MKREVTELNLYEDTTMPLKTLSNSTSLLRCAGRGEDRSISSPQHFKLGSTEAVGLERKHPLENEDVNQGKENNQ